jgi:hypothetical protein
MERSLSPSFLFSVGAINATNGKFGDAGDSKHVDTPLLACPVEQIFASPAHIRHATRALSQVSSRSGEVCGSEQSVFS